MYDIHTHTHTNSNHSTGKNDLYRIQAQAIPTIRDHIPQCHMENELHYFDLQFTPFLVVRGTLMYGRWRVKDGL